MWPNYRKPLLMYAQQYFCNKPHYKKQWAKYKNPIIKLCKLLIASIVSWINTLINKSWVSLCLSAHWEFENLCFVMVLRLVLELWPFVHVAVTKEFMDNLFPVNTPSLSGMKIYMDCQLYFGGCRNFWWIKWAKFQLCTPLH